MPRKVTAKPDWVEELSVPRDGEGVDYGDVNGPFVTLLGCILFLRQVTLDLSQEIADLKRTRGGFLLAAPGLMTAKPARSYPVTVGIGRYDGFTGAVDLDAQNLPAGVTVTFNPDNTADSRSTMTLTVDAQAVPGTFDVFVTGVSDTVQASAKLQLTVTAATLPSRFDFTPPGQLGIDRATGTSGQLPISLTRQGGFTEPIQFSVQNLPAGMEATIAPNPVTGNSSAQPNAAQVTITAGASLPAGTYSITLRAVSGQQVLTRSVAVSVTAAPVVGSADFSLRVVYNTGDRLSANGATVYIDRTGGYAGPVLLNAVPDIGYGPTLLVDGRPWQNLIYGNTARIVADTTGRLGAPGPTGWAMKHAGVTENVDGIVGGVAKGSVKGWQPEYSTSTRYADLNWLWY